MSIAPVSYTHLLLPIGQPQLAEHVLQNKPGVDVVVNTDGSAASGKVVGHVLVNHRRLSLMGQKLLRIEQNANGGRVSQGPALDNNLYRVLSSFLPQTQNCLFPGFWRKRNPRLRGFHLLWVAVGGAVCYTTSRKEAFP